MIYSASIIDNKEDRLNGYYAIHTKTELDNIVGKSEPSKIILHNDFVNKFFTPLGLEKYIKNTRIYNPLITIVTDKDCETLEVDKFIRKLSKVEDIEELIWIALSREEEFFNALRLLTDNYIKHDNELLDASSNIALLQSIIDNDKDTINLLKEELIIERRNKLLANTSLSVLIGRINNQYNIGIDKSKLFYTDSTNKYDRIIYIKELTRVQYVDTFIYYLKEIFKILHQIPARILIIEGYYATDKVKLYPHLVPHYQLHEKDILSGDILMLGTQPKILNDVLRNSSSVSVLIVLDRAGYIVPHIIGDKVEYYYTVSDLKDRPDNIDNQHLISYDKETLYIPYDENFNTYDINKKIQRYSSMDIMKTIINYKGR